MKQIKVMINLMTLSLDILKRSNSEACVNTTIIPLNKSTNMLLVSLIKHKQNNGQYTTKYSNQNMTCQSALSLPHRYNTT